MVIRVFKRFIEDQRGAVLPMAVVMFPIILGMAGLGVDTSRWMMIRRDLQNAADAAAIAGAWEVANGYQLNYQAAGLREAIENGYDNTIPGANLDVIYILEEDGTEKVTANLEMPAKVLFAGLVFGENVKLANAAATAIIGPTGNYCILSLDEEADAAVSAVGTADVDANGCGLAVNSGSDTALDLTGNVIVNVGDVSIVGEEDVGNNVTFNYDSLRTNANPIPDPYRNLEVPDYAGWPDCVVVANATTSGNCVFRGGRSIAGNASFTFAPGVYIFEDGDLRITGNSGTVSGDGVSLVFTGTSPGNVGGA